MVQGRLLDKQTKQPLPYAAIYVSSRKAGTVTNSEGRFSVRLDQPSPADTLRFSMIGYQTQRLPLSALVERPGNHTLLLEPVAQRLREVVVRPVDPVELVLKAVQRIHKNYSNQPGLLTGFYREWVREKDLLLLSEGQLELYKASYGRSSYADAVRMLKGRRKPLPGYFLSGADTCRLPDITNGPHLGIMLDIAKLTNLGNFLLPLGSASYDYAYEGMSSANDRDAYVISFTPQSSLPSATNTAYFTGKLLIDQQSLAIVQADFYLSKTGLQQVNRGLSVYQLPIRLLRRHYQVTYQPIRDRYVLHHAQAENHYQYTARRAELIRNQMDFVVTKTSFDHVQKFARRETIREDQSFTEQIMGFDESFWANDNVISDEP